MLAAHIQEAVNGTAAPEDLAAWPFQFPPVQTGIRLGDIAPVGFRVMDGLEIAHRYVNPRIPVTATCLQQRDGCSTISRKAVCQYTAS